MNCGVGGWAARDQCVCVGGGGVQGSVGAGEIRQSRCHDLAHPWVTVTFPCNWPGSWACPAGVHSESGWGAGLARARAQQDQRPYSDSLACVAPADSGSYSYPGSSGLGASAAQESGRESSSELCTNVSLL